MSIAQTQQTKMARSIEDVLRNLDKRAEAYTENGSQGGPTSHPVKNVDDGTEKAREGFRSEENTSDVKEDQPAGVDSTTPGTPGGQQSVQMNIGITSKATGEDSTNETDSAKAGKDDPGSSHPARTDNNALDGQKYSSLYEQFQHLSKTAAMLGNDLVAEIAAEAHSQTKAAANTPAAKLAAAAQPVAPAPTPAPAPAPAAPVAKEAAAGAALADAQPVFDKQAIDNQLVDSLAQTILAAQESAVKVAEVIRGYTEQQAATKRAEEEGAEGPRHESSESPAQERSEDAGGGPPGNPPSGGAESGDSGHMSGQRPAGGDQAMLMQLLQMILGGQHMGGQDAAAAMMAPGGGGGGGMPPEAGGGGMPPEAGGMPPEAGGGGDDMAMLQQVLQDTGSNPAELEAAAAGKQAQLLAQRQQATRATVAPVWTAKTAADKAKYAATRSYIEELLGRKSR